MITKATLKDVTEITKLVNSAYRGETSKKGWTTEANILEGERISESELTEILLNTENTFLIYRENNKIIGTVLLTNKKTELYLGMLTVSPELQNSGLGKKLLIAAEDLANAIPLPKIVMTVISIREELIAWYQRNGYLDTGKREPFPSIYNDVVLHSEPLEFSILEKVL
ncbi:GNAT family N-acetyltransferase [Flavobacterium difficile]|uniref:GNAT family N-acetyltransferase n=1 Tax=Flavobacterium difficile TaxID=2709659 RepID=A0ABX0I9T2_9FLAO|nr:GNAT family N-acetyltransferase [Flavobacterium difficile]NHM02215.1 GNAT family N-acetyltransferase [Flavobacterium difficile]